MEIIKFDIDELKELWNKLIEAKENHNIPAVANYLDQIEAKKKHYNIVAYVVDADRNVKTKNDTELYLKLTNADKTIYYDDLNRDQYVKTIRLSYNNAPDINLIVDNSNGSNIKLIDEKEFSKFRKKNLKSARVSSNRLTKKEMNINYKKNSDTLPNYIRYVSPRLIVKNITHKIMPPNYLY